VGGAPTDWRTTCAGLTLNGRCTGNVYQWCDYYTGSVQSLDCDALGATCRANPTESNEDDANGCVGAACTNANSHCNGRFKVQCFGGALVTTDCAKWYGSTATCALVSGYVQCQGGVPCDSPHTVTCDGSVARTCGETSQVIIDDCARSDPAGTCVQLSSNTVNCGGIVFTVG
jgi:hypothetical protein